MLRYPPNLFYAACKAKPASRKASSAAANCWLHPSGVLRNLLLVSSPLDFLSNCKKFMRGKGLGIFLKSIMLQFLQRDIERENSRLLIALKGRGFPLLGSLVGIRSQAMSATRWLCQPFALIRTHFSIHAFKAELLR